VFALVLVALTAGGVGLYANSTAPAHIDRSPARRVAAGSIILSLAAWTALLVLALTT
jgi:hypothetical protein